MACFIGFIKGFLSTSLEDDLERSQLEYGSTQAITNGVALIR